jgi:Na+/proline symporter
MVMRQLDYSFIDAVKALAADERSRIFVMDDWLLPHNFWKQLFSGMFIVIVMTGLDQDMMQKNLTCRTLREAQKDMCSYGLAFLPANMLFLALGILLAQLFEMQGVPIPEQGDQLLIQFTAPASHLPPLSPLPQGGVGGGFSPLSSLFLLGIVAASFSSADSALTSLTTSFCVDIRRRPDDERLRKRTHLIICGLFVAVIMVFHLLNNRSLIDAIYTIVGYTYGPLLGLFAFGLFTRWQLSNRWVPVVCVASPVVCYLASQLSQQLWDYHFGYELLLLNGLLTFAGLCLIRSHISTQ